jgi:hypothetical protein
MITFCLITGVLQVAPPCDYPVTLEPCAYEDSADCYWNAQERGNGIGQSFVDIDGIAFTWVSLDEYIAQENGLELAAYDRGSI